MYQYEDICLILGNVAYKDWTLRVVREGPDAHSYLQWLFLADRAMQYSRKWILSPHMTKSELVSTAFKAAISAEEHECREEFRYKGKKIFGPHFDVDKLAEIAGLKVNLDLRETVP